MLQGDRKKIVSMQLDRVSNLERQYVSPKMDFEAPRVSSADNDPKARLCHGTWRSTEGRTAHAVLWQASVVALVNFTKIYLSQFGFQAPDTYGPETVLLEEAQVVSREYSEKVTRLIGNAMIVPFGSKGQIECV